jgi:hypothetical protein
MTDGQEGGRFSAHIYAVCARKPQVREPRTPKISELEPSQDDIRSRVEGLIEQLIPARAV